MAITHNLIARDHFERDDVGYRDPDDGTARRIPIPNHLAADVIYLKATHQTMPGNVGRFEEVGRRD
jgi:hypothetical protein